MLLQQQGCFIQRCRKANEGGQKMSSTSLHCGTTAECQRHSENEIYNRLTTEHYDDLAYGAVQRKIDLYQIVNSLF